VVRVKLMYSECVVRFKGEGLDGAVR
jgi:hypothetical protein